MKKIISLVLCMIMIAMCSGLAGCTPPPAPPGPGGDEGGNPSDEFFAYPLLNAGFESDLELKTDYLWDMYMYDAQYSYSSETKKEGARSLKEASDIGGYMSVWQVVPIPDTDYNAKFNSQFAAQDAFAGENGGRMPRRGDKVEFSIDFFNGSGTPLEDAESLKLQIKCENARKTATIIAQSNITALEKDKWVTVSTQALSNGGIIPDDTVVVVFSFMIDIPEGVEVYFDNAVCGTYTKLSEEEGEEPGDDEGLAPPAQSYDSFDNRGVFYNIPNNSFESGVSVFNLNGAAGSPMPVGSAQAYYGEKSATLAKDENATWRAAYNAAAMGELKTISAGVWIYIAGGNGQAGITLEIRTGGEFIEVAKSYTSAKNRWVYVKTPIMPETDAKRTVSHIQIKFYTEAEGETYFDFVQLGDWQRISGNPNKMAILSYQPWFTDAAGGWGNWRYDSTAAGGRFYNPANVLNSGTPDQKRDIASVYYPEIGAYNSNDREVLEYHVQIIKAMGFDCIQVNYYADLSVYQKEVLEKLFDLSLEYDMKMSVLIEPKIHFNGWIPHGNRAESVNAVGQDLVNLINKYKNHKAFLKYNDKFLIGVFGINILSGAEWGQVKAKVLDSTGFNILLSGEGIGNNDYSDVESMFQWSLYSGAIATGGTEEAKAHCKLLNEKAIEWNEGNAFTKVPMGMVFPGFDDTTVRQWASTPTNPRKINITGPDFYNASWDAFAMCAGDLDWVNVATFNDWTEGTILEPTRELGHSIALITSQKIAAWKGTTASTLSQLEKITSDYLNGRMTNYI